MLRACPLLLSLLAAVTLFAQGPTGGDTGAITYTRSIAVPLNAVLLFDKATEAWTWTFGKEPGGKLLLSDRTTGTLEATARVNYRSEQLSMREETMGAVQYRVVMNVHAGECRITISECVHTGNRTTPRGGVHLGLLVRGPDPVVKVRGLGGSNLRRIYAEVKDTTNARITAVLQAFEARLRASAQP